MKTKTRIVTIAISMCMVLAVMVVGIFAATSATFTGSGNITIESDPNLQIKVDYQGESRQNFDTEDMTPFDFDGLEFTRTTLTQTIALSASNSGNRDSIVTLTADFSGVSLPAGGSFTATFDSGDTATTKAVDQGQSNVSLDIVITYVPSSTETHTEITGTFTLSLAFAVV